MNCTLSRSRARGAVAIPIMHREPVISLKYGNLGTTPVNITEILRFSEKNPRKFDENLQNLPSSLSKINKNCAEFCKNGAKVLKNHRNLEWCKGKNVDLVKSFPTSIYLQTSASIQPRTSLSKLGDLHLLGPENFSYFFLEF